jgi:hypothetical protein
MEEEHEIRRQVEIYLGASKPIHWVNWLYRCQGTDSNRVLEAILFESRHLRDLTGGAVRAEVLAANSQTPCAMEWVIADLADEVRNQTEK